MQDKPRPLQGSTWGAPAKMWLKAVGHPVAVNPDPLLAREARRRGWPIRRFRR